MQEKNVKANPEVILRDDFEEAAVLFNPTDGKTFSLNKTGLVIWRHLDGKHNVDQIAVEVSNQCSDVSDNVKNHISSLIDMLVDKGLAGRIV